ncbi:MAG: hypothetical protein PHD12_03095 [Methylotenera sp.]|nr:hypothetical protein [Methylotenera sp.]
MEKDLEKPRWKLIDININDCKLSVLDECSEKKHTYYIPSLLHAEIVQQNVYVLTSQSKIMRLNLLTAARRFILANDFDCLEDTQIMKQVCAKG